MVLTRDDLIVACLVVLAFLAVAAPNARRKRVLIVAGGLVVVAIAAHTAFRLAYYGNALPNTYYLKLSGIALTERLHRGVASFAYSLFFGLYTAIVLAVVAVAARARRSRPGVILPALLFIGQVAYSIYVGGDAWENFQFPNRFLSVALPGLLVLAAIGSSDTVRLVARSRRAALAVAAGCAIGGLVLLRGWLPSDLLQTLPDPGWHPVRLIFAAFGVALVALVWHLGRSRYLHAPAALVVSAIALAALAVVQLDTYPVRSWRTSNAQLAWLDTAWARTGLVLRQDSAPSATIALWGAGNEAYFDDRPAIDLLGKSDTVIARERPHPVVFRPGHMKWDLRYSVGRLRPAIIDNQVWLTTRADLCMIASYGYVQVTPTLWVRRGDRRVSVARLASTLAPPGWHRKPTAPCRT